MRRSAAALAGAREPGVAVLDFSPAGLLVGFVLSALGAAYVAWGRRMGDLPRLVCGMLLVVVPWFVGALWPLLAIGAGLLAAPWVGEALGWW